MATVNYTVVDGEVLSEDRGGAKRDYVPDPLGSTRALLDSSQTITDTWDYWPYGEVESRTGASPTPFTFVGTRGYHKDATGLTYVRARYYSSPNASWMTIDPAWPYFASYRYCSSAPVAYIDPEGAFQRRSQWESPFRFEGCTELQRRQINAAFHYFCKNILDDLRPCLERYACKLFTGDHVAEAISDLCRNEPMGFTVTVVCKKCGGCGQHSHLTKGKIYICHEVFGEKDCGAPYCVIVHELIHMFGLPERSGAIDCIDDWKGCESWKDKALVE